MFVSLSIHQKEVSRMILRNNKQAETPTLHFSDIFQHAYTITKQKTLQLQMQ